MAKLFRSRADKRGLPPGAAVYVGKARDEKTSLELIAYDEAAASSTVNADIATCIAGRAQPGVSWVNLTGLGDVPTVKSLCEKPGLHPLVVEDILNTDQRPKFEDYGDYLYAVLKMLRWDADQNEVLSEQVSLVLVDGMVISFQEIAGDVFDPIRQRIEHNKGRIRKMDADYLFYCLIDAVVDGYFEVLERIGEKLEALEADLLDSADPKALRKLHSLKSESLILRKSIWPMREVVSSLQRCESPLLGESIGIYLRDVYDHAFQVIDTLDTVREMLSGMREAYLSNASNRMNEIMKVLTIIATIFIPLTFIAGIYGMNFEYMPELKFRYGYHASVALMLLIAGCMLVYFKRKKWL